MTTTPIGWSPTAIKCCLKQGGSGMLRIAMVVTKANGDPLDSYDGWTAAVALFRTPAPTAEIQMTPTVASDVPSMQLIVDLDFESAVTKDVRPGHLVGDLVLISPDGEGNYPIDLELEIDRSYSAVP